MTRQRSTLSMRQRRPTSTLQTRRPSWRWSSAIGQLWTFGTSCGALAMTRVSSRPPSRRSRRSHEGRHDPYPARPPGSPRRRSPRLLRVRLVRRGAPERPQRTVRDQRPGWLRGRERAVPRARPPRRADVRPPSPGQGPRGEATSIRRHRDLEGKEEDMTTAREEQEQELRSIADFKPKLVLEGGTLHTFSPIKGPAGIGGQETQKP